MRSRVTLNVRPTSSSVRGGLPSSPYRSSSTARSRGDSICSTFFSVERDRRLRAPPDLLDLVGCELELASDLVRQRLAAELGAQLPLRTRDLVELLDDVHGHADRARLVGERARDRLPDPPRCVRRELEALAIVELLRRANEPDRAFLDQVEERQALVSVPLRDRDDEPQVRLDHLLLRTVVAALDPLCELNLLCSREQIDPTDVFEEELQRIGRDLAHDLADGTVAVVRRRLGADDGDVQLLERVVEGIERRRLEVELGEGERDLLRAQ
jgi:hypothetical protein